MGVPILTLLAVVWAIVLVPPYLRHRSDARPGSSVNSFQQGLDVLGRTAPSGSLGPVRPSGPGVPVGRAALRRRRGEVLVALAAFAGFTLLLAVAFGGLLVLAHMAADVALAGYLYLLVQIRRAADDHAHKVRYLPAVEVVPAGAPRLVVVRRSASG